MKDTQVKLLQTAAHLFAQNGFSGTSVRQIVEEADVNIAAINYHFGDKRGLYLATIRYLVEQTNEWMFGGEKGIVLPTDISSFSREEMLSLFKQIQERMLELVFSRRTVLLERIFRHADMETSKDLVEILLEYKTRFNEILYQILSRLTGFEKNSGELVILANTIFSQVHQSDFGRFVVLHSLKKKEYTPELKELIKKIVWQNTCAILESYKVEKETNA